MNDINQNKIDSMEDWRNEHGKPDFEYLQSLIQDDGPLAREKFYAIADDLNVTYDKNTTLNDLSQKIRMAVEKGSHTTT
jgi:hypothetical protein